MNTTTTEPASSQSHEEPLYEGDADAPRAEPGPANPDPRFRFYGRPLTPFERIERVRALLRCLSDVFELSGEQYSPHFGDHVRLCDWAGTELDAVSRELLRER